MLTLAQRGGRVLYVTGMHDVCHKQDPGKEKRCCQRSGEGWKGDPASQVRVSYNEKTHFMRVQVPHWSGALDTVSLC